MQSIEADNLHMVAELFGGHRRRRHLIDHAIENRIGSAVVDEVRAPHVAALRVGQVTLLGGDPSAGAAREIVKELSQTIATPETQSWNDLICEVHADKVKRRQRTEFTSAKLDTASLEVLANSSGDGVRIERLDVGLSERLAAEVGDGFFGKFRSIIHFTQIGFGHCAIVDDHIACGATAAVVCHRGIGVQIETHPEFRRMGLATSVGATLILECLDRSVDPHWSAATPISARLALKLGYTEDDVFDELIIST